MKKTVSILGLIAVFLIALDIGVAALLHWGEGQGRMGSLVRYFEYGRSVPGKLNRWEAMPGAAGNLYDVAWRSDIQALSVAGFAQEGPDEGPVIRSYGMSFVNNIIEAALERTPDIAWDDHSGPGAPPNFTYAVFQEDRANRRPGDIVVLGVLSSAIPAMAALSNRTWVFEQPAPFTYPVYWPTDDAGLRRVEPLVNSADDQRRLDGTQKERDWTAQLAAEDAFYSPVTFGVTWLDVSPFARLVRRSLAKRHVMRTEANILGSGDYPYAEVLQRMIVDFSRTARADGQIPIVLLIQSRDPADAEVASIARPVLEREDVAYLATVDHFDPKDPTGFVGDGHYTPQVDALFGTAFLELLPADLVQR
jgi:hypothetical protein